MSGPNAQHVPVDPGDVGRRVRRRREELGLSRAEVAARAGMVAEYVTYLEERSPNLTAETLLRLAAALQTTDRALLGGGVDLPPGRGRPARRPVLEELDVDECFRLLSAGGVGRLAFPSGAGLLVLPVNFALVDRTVIVRAQEGSPQVACAEAEEASGDELGGEITFEVDHLDEVTSEGWSVLVIGRVRRVTDPDELRRLRQRAGVEPWAGGEREVYLAVTPQRVTGRRIHAG